MLINTIKTNLIFAFIFLLFCSCGTTKNTTKQSKDKLTAVCLRGKMPVREFPHSKGKYLTSIYYGETISTYGETLIDSSRSKTYTYLKIILKDGTEGWTLKSVIAVDVIPHVIVSRTGIYKRPDMLTPLKKQFERMQFIVVSETQDDWVKVKGKRPEDGWFTEGWVKSSHITSVEIDVNAAILTRRALNLSDKKKKINALNAIFFNPNFSETQFIPDLEKIIESINKQD